MSGSIIMNRGEFVDALAALSRGNVIVRLGDESDAFLLDGVRLLWSFPALIAYGLVTEFTNPHGFVGARYYRMTSQGRQFAKRALEAWRARPVIERMAIRLLG